MEVCGSRGWGQCHTDTYERAQHVEPDNYHTGTYDLAQHVDPDEHHMDMCDAVQHPRQDKYRAHTSGMVRRSEVD
eukprot:5823069-Alexandrium_andersonii.AAC.1